MVKYSLQTKHTLIQFIIQEQIAELKWNVVDVGRSEREPDRESRLFFLLVSKQ